MKRLLPLLAIVLSACSHPGHLIIAGGAVEPDNATVYEHLVATLPSNATVAILPTASGVPDESMAAATKTIMRYAGTRPVRPIHLTTANAADASSTAVVDAIDTARALWFTGGDQSRILSTFRPRSGDTPAYAATRRLLDRRGVIAGSSAGAAMMCDPMIMGGTSEDALLGRVHMKGGGATESPEEDTGFRIGQGMGYFPYGLVDQHFLKRGRLGRLVVALELTNSARGYGIEENSAIDVDLQRHTITVLGTVVLVDLSHESRENSARRGIRVSLLNWYDMVDATSGSVATSRPPVAKAALAIPTSPLPEAWKPDAIREALLRLAADPSHSVTLSSPAFRLTFSADRQTRLNQGTHEVTIVNAVLDIDQLPHP